MKRKKNSVAQVHSPKVNRKKVRGARRVRPADKQSRIKGVNNDEPINGAVTADGQFRITYTVKGGDKKSRNRSKYDVNGEVSSELAE